MATTVHYINRDDYSLKSGLLAIVRFTGSHTGERIGVAFETVVDSYDIRHKIDHIVTDNAANMRKAFNVCFISVDDDTTGDAMLDLADVDEPEKWEVLPDEEISTVYSVIDAGSQKERLACYCHSLHLTVQDGLKDTKCVSTVVAKASKLSSLLHQSQIFKDEF